VSVQPNGIRVVGSSVVQNDFFRCVFGGRILLNATTFGTDFVICPGPTVDGSSSSLPQTIQLANDHRASLTYSNSLQFTRIAGSPPSITMINPSSAGKNCLRTYSCPTVTVYGNNFSGSLGYQCVFFGAAKPGQYRGTTNTLPNGTMGSYEIVTCPQIPTYTGPIATNSNITRNDGFYLMVYRSGTGYVSSNAVPFTYTNSF